MAKVSLRIYNRDIENLVDQGLLDEAVAHCSHILKTFPKHLETYRLLGKAYLEAKRYDEAVDIFQRVLVAVPDDFVSHVGMSIIRDDQGKPDDAIWHMERAFESQPSNAAIQGELRRLYGRRDGVEPPKIRMTRGALAHMYVQGELYPQAISEIKAVLGQDPQRADMQVLLALAYFRSGQKADAAEVCNQLLKQPGGENCFEASRVMIELLQGSDMPEDVDLYRQRVNQLDPYAALAPHSVFQSGAVSDAAVTLERLEYSGQRIEMDTDWSASGIGLGSTTPQQPDWLSAAATPAEVEPVPAAPAEAAPAASNEIPDFLRQAGWGESTGAAEEGPSPFSIEETPPVAESDLAAGDMPDWLKAMSPEDASPSAAPEEMPSTTSFGASSDWLKGTPEAEPATPESQADVPDWLGDLAGQAQSRAAADEASITPEDTPTWLGGLGGLEAAPDEAAVESPAEEAVLPDWLSSQKPAEPVESAPAADLPSASLDTLGATAQEQDDAVAWLEGLAAKHGAKPEELVTDPNARTETPPEWVEQARALAESQAGSVTASAAPQFEPADESVDTDDTDDTDETDETDELEVASEDETGIWLRGLAEKEIFGQPTESPEPEPAARLESAPAEESDDEKPAWLRNLEAVAPSQPVPPEPEPLEEAVATDLPSWLQGLDQETPREDLAEARSLEVENELPGWLAEEEVAASAVPTTPADWQPVGPEVSAGTGLPEAEDEAEPEAEAVRPPSKPAEPAQRAAAPAVPTRPAARPRPAQKPQAPNVVLETAQAELSRGDIPAAIEHYGKLIKKGRHTEEVIRDLREALYRYPVEVTVWQALGDAYMRANRLQEALDAYTKAEELLR